MVYDGKLPIRQAGYNQRHTLVLQNGDLYGFRATRLKKYQVIKGDHPEIPFRNIPPENFKKFFDKSVAYKGKIPTKREIEEGFVRRSRVPTKPEDDRTKPNRLTDEWFRPSKQFLNEAREIDCGNYQWREVLKPVQLFSKKQQKVKGTLRTGATVGMRYETPAKGGYIIVDDERIHISHELYETIIESTRILPQPKQRFDIIVLDIGDAAGKEAVKEIGRNPFIRKVKEIPVIEETIVRRYNVDQLDDGALDDFMRRKKRQLIKKRQHVERFMDNTVDEITWKDMEDDEDFADAQDFLGEKEKPVKPVKEKQTKGPVKLKPKAKDLDRDIDDQLDRDFGPEEDEKEVKRVTPQSYVADFLQIGMKLKANRNQKEYIVLDASRMERNDKLIELKLYCKEDEEFYRIRIDAKMPLSEFNNMLVQTGQISGKELKELIAESDMAEYLTANFTR